MSLQAVLAPLFVQVALTFALLSWLAFHRVSLIRSGAVKRKDIALREPNWPPRVLQIQNAAANQSEVPVLFYVLTILAIITRRADLFFVVLGWVFVLLRVVHAYIHVTDNNVARRGLVFIAASAVLMAMWAIFMFRILLGA